MKKIKKIFNLLVLVLPFILIGISIFKNYDLINVSGSNSFTVVLGLIRDSMLGLLQDTPLDDIYTWIENTFFTNNEGWETIPLIFFSYYFWTQFIGLIMDILVFVVEYARKLINGFYGKENL